MKRVDPRLLGMHLGRPVTGPDTLHIDITNGCNTNCVTCWDHSPHLTVPRPQRWKRQRIDAATVTDILNEVSELGGLRAVILSGMGEPFTHPEVYDMIAEIKRRGLHLTIITNLVAAQPQRIVDLGVDQLLIGLHAASAETYRAFHPSFVNDEWQRVLAMLAQFREAGRRFKHIHVICRENAHELVAMIRQAAEYKAEQVNFKLASLREGTEAVRISDEQRQKLMAEWLPAARQEAERLNVTANFAVFADQLRAGEEATAPIEDIGCFMGYSYARILVDGTVLYCCSPEVVIGNLSDGSFPDLWDGPRWNQIRAQLRRGEYFPACHQCGKFNMNHTLSQRFAQAFSQERLYQVTGRKP
ncbi:MAG TPA: radical SAM protein [Pseudomonadota bacterium]|jgi:MoaA/NifB/PqqE/SkfB family radical SAM enzyme|nr:radical SAM protein [Pseudomonadota bacterium]